MEYEFTLKYQLIEDENVDAMLERLAESGCDDAMVGVGQPGRLALTFVREAPSAREAIESALRDVRTAVPSARLIEATPDLVGLTDVAEIIGVSRQNMRKLMLSHMYSFPAPIHEGSTSLWHLADVLIWLQARGSYAIGQDIVDLARVAMSVNVSRAHQRIFG
ncbi:MULTISPECIES: AlpA family transcriptional regulator [Pseudomonas]|uniref:helix-turn-helix transcriptional regulator n=1 Tax=Pseudomonas TaxID=286 RepID=UPI002188A58B|nr:DNA-binding protein [Pseudomonas sp. LRP2-20]BDM24570.1 DNA-binding protein [Pseudomonas sp. LRP2-20]